MAQPQDMVKCIERFHNRIKRFCDPLVHHFGVKEFCHQKEMFSGKSKSISLNQDYLNFYYSENVFDLNPISIHPKYHQEGLIFIDSIDDKSTKILAHDAKIKFGIHFGFVLCYSVMDGMEFFSFGLSSSAPAQFLKFYNEIALIKMFIKRFKEEFKSAIAILDEYAIDMANLKGRSYEKTFDLSSQDTERLEFLRKIGAETPEPLTSKENEVVKYFIKGLSAPKIATQLLISPRTVEHHLERIKDKLNCMTKPELVEKIQLLKSVGYLNFSNQTPFLSNAKLFQIVTNDS